MNSRDNWWEHFFEGLIVDFWRSAMSPETTRAEADFLEARLGVSPGATVLDVPCGAGRLALELARRGYRMMGVDISAEFLAHARSNALGQGLAIEWRHSDMRDLAGLTGLDAAFCGGSSFGYLGDEGDLAFLQAVAHALRPGARFVIDSVKAAEVVLPHFRDRYEMDVGGIVFAAENRYDHESGWMDNRYTVRRGDRVEERNASHRVYSYRELARLLETAGFEQIEAMGSLAGQPFQLGSPRLILLATRKTAAASRS